MHSASPDLNVDRLLPPTEERKPSSQTPAKQGDAPIKAGASEEDARRTELPPLLRRLTAQVQVDVTRGEYRGQAFQDMQLRAEYEHGVIKSHSFDVNVGDGHFGTIGSADLMNLEAISFSVKPTVTTVPLESISALVGMDEATIKGPLTMTGQVQGRTGSVVELLESLMGTLEGQMGPGQILKLGGFGNALFKMLALINVSDIVGRRSMVDLRTDALLYDSIDIKASFEDGDMNVVALNLKSPSLEMEATSKVDLVNREIEGTADVTVLRAVDKGLGYVPLVGGAVASMMKVYMNIDGPLLDPRITHDFEKKATDAAGNVIEAPGEMGKKAIKGVGKGLDKVF
jgi:uncharacterized protein YhdP